MTSNQFFANYPHMFKLLQMINAVVLLICLSGTTPIEGDGILWFVAMFSLIVSTAATVLYSRDQHEQIAAFMTDKFISWILIVNLRFFEIFLSSNLRNSFIL